MPAQPRVLVLVQRGAVEALEGPRVGREVAGDPVDQHPDARLVQLVDQVPELIGEPNFDIGAKYPVTW